MATQITPAQGGVSREFDRAYSAELLFDKNYTEALLHVQDDVITFTVASSGHLENQECTLAQRITVDGVNPIYFVGFPHISNISQGEVLEAGTYQFIFWYTNGIARATVMLPSEEAANLTPLSAPANFAAVAAGETQIDLEWDAVTNVSSYEIDYSTTGGSGPWTSLTPSPGAGDTTFAHTGLTAGTTYHYRIRAIGDMITFANSLYSVDAETTADAGDVTDPTFTSSPVDSAIDIPMNKVVVFTSDEALIDADGVTEITNANILDYLTAVNSSAVAQPITATIDVTKKIITVTPDVVWTELDDITITLDGVEDLNGNEPAAFAITFTTSDFTEMNVNYLSLGTQIDSVIVGADKNFVLKATYQDFLHVASIKGLFQKYIASGSNNKSFVAYTDGDDVVVSIYDGTITNKMQITWPNALVGITDGEFKFEYFGALDTNGGLDRWKFYIDAVEVTSGKNVSDLNGTWPFDIGPSTQPFYLSGPAFREVKDFQVLNNMGATTIVDIPIIRTGTDNSGNSFDGTWI